MRVGASSVAASGIEWQLCTRMPAVIAWLVETVYIHTYMHCHAHLPKQFSAATPPWTSPFSDKYSRALEICNYMNTCKVSIHIS